MSRLASFLSRSLYLSVATLIFTFSNQAIVLAADPLVESSAIYGDHTFYQNNVANACNSSPGTATNAAPVGNLTNLRDQIAQMLFVRADTKAEALDVVGTHHVGGVFVTNEFGKEMLDPANISEVKAKFTPAPYFGIDEEGGIVDRLGIISTNAKQMGAMTNDQVKQIAADAATKMKANSIDVDFAPVVDIDSPNSEAIGKINRSFSADTNVIVEKAGAFAEGLKQGGITPTFKHFPGIGHTTVNSDAAVGATPGLAELKKADLIPYEKLIASDGGKSWIMMSNYSVPDLTGGEAASISKPAYDLLRNDYNFKGIIITDDLAAGALGPVAKYVANPDIVVKAIKAGTDVALFGGSKQVKEIIDKVEAAANTDEALKTHITEASNKIVAAKAAQGPAVQTAGGCCNAAATVLTGSAGREQIWNYFVGKYSAVQIAGIIGNTEGESGSNPRRVEGTETPKGDSDSPDSRGYGIVQFTPGTKILQGLEAYNKQHDPDVKAGDMAFQLNFLYSQLIGEGIGAYISEKTAGDHLKTAQTVEDAEHIFLKEYERAGIDREEVRLAAAKQAMADFGSGGAGGSPTVGATTGTCGSVNGVVSGSIVQTAVNLSWDDTGHGKTEADAKSTFQEAFKTFYLDKGGTNTIDPYSDCSVFVGTVMRASGADPDFPVRGTTIMWKYVHDHPEKFEIVTDNVTSESQLKPGDILVADADGGHGGTYNHIALYVGPQAGGFSVREASLHDHVPESNNLWHLNSSYAVARKK